MGMRLSEKLDLVQRSLIYNWDDWGNFYDAAILIRDHGEELRQALRDRDRYRWLREHFRFANDSMNEIWFDGSLEPDDSGIPSDLDASLDATMGRREGDDNG